MGTVHIQCYFKCAVQQNGRNVEYVFNKTLVIINVWCLTLLFRLYVLKRYLMTVKRRTTSCSRSPGGATTSLHQVAPLH